MTVGHDAPAALLHGRDGNMPRAHGRPPWSNHDFDILVQGGQELQQAFNRELIQPVVLQRRDFRLRDVQQLGGLTLLQLARFQQVVVLRWGLRGSGELRRGQHPAVSHK